MAGESKEILELSKHLIPVFSEIRNAARMMADASEKLSNTGLDKFTDQLKKSLKSQELITEADEAQIKDAKSLQKVLGKLEEQYEALHKLEKEASRIAKSSIGDAKVSAAVEKEALAAARASIAAKYDEHDISLDMVDALKKGVPLIRQEAEARLRQIASTDRLSKAHEGLTESIGKQIAGFTSFGAGMALLKKGVFNYYDQMNRLSGKGMLGSMHSLQLMSVKLFISAQDLEEIMNKNRDLVNSMGGGVAGMEAFGDEIKTVRKNLEYLGKDASKAAARFIEMSKKAGLTPKDGSAYRKNLNSSIEQFKEFSGLFGDSYEDYASLMEQMNEEEETRKRLNVLSKSQLQLELEEIRQRTANLKLMGLSNQQIVEFNKKIETLIDPRKNNFAQRATEAYATKASLDAMSQILQRGGTPEDAKLLAELQANKASVEKIASLYAGGNQVELAKFMKSEEGLKAARAMSKAAAKTDQANQFERAFSADLMGRGGNLWQTISSSGDQLATAQSKDRDLTGKKPAELEALKAAAKDMVAEHSNAATALAGMTMAVEGVKAALETPFLQAITGAAIALWGLAAAAGASGLLGMVKKVTGALGVGGGKGLLGIAGRAGAVGAAGVAGYAAGKYVVNPVLDKGAELTSRAFGGNDKTVGGAIYSGIDNLQGRGYLPGQSDSQKQQAAEAAAWKSQYQSKLKSQGFITKKQADLYRANGVGVDSSKIKQEGATVGMANSASTGGGTPYNFESFAKTLGQRESGGNYAAVNTIGFVGKYQFGAAALEDMGLIKKGASKQGNKALNDPSNWTIPGGLQAFLGNQQLQEDTFKKYTDLHYKQLIRAGVITPESPPSEVAGYLAAAHLKGIGGAIDLKRGKNGTDAYGTSAGSYFALGGRSQGVNSAAVSSPPFSTPTGTASAASPTAAIAAATTAATTSSAATAAPTTVAMADSKSGGTETVSELKKQTSLLSQLVSNSMGSGRMGARPDSYMQDSATVMSGSAS